MSMIYFSRCHSQRCWPSSFSQSSLEQTGSMSALWITILVCRMCPSTSHAMPRSALTCDARLRCWILPHIEISLPALRLNCSGRTRWTTSPSFCELCGQRNISRTPFVCKQDLWNPKFDICIESRKGWKRKWRSVEKWSERNPTRTTRSSSNFNQLRGCNSMAYLLNTMSWKVENKRWRKICHDRMTRYSSRFRWLHYSMETRSPIESMRTNI